MSGRLLGRFSLVDGTSHDTAGPPAYTGLRRLSPPRMCCRAGVRRGRARTDPTSRVWRWTSRTSRGVRRSPGGVQPGSPPRPDRPRSTCFPPHLERERPNHGRDRDVIRIAVRSTGTRNSVRRAGDQTGAQGRPMRNAPLRWRWYVGVSLAALLDPRCVFVRRRRGQQRRRGIVHHGDAARRPAGRSGRPAGGDRTGQRWQGCAPSGDVSGVGRRVRLRRGGVLRRGRRVRLCTAGRAGRRRAVVGDPLDDGPLPDPHRGAPARRSRPRSTGR